MHITRALAYARKFNMLQGESERERRALSCYVHVRMHACKLEGLAGRYERGGRLGQGLRPYAAGGINLNARNACV